MSVAILTNSEHMEELYVEIKDGPKGEKTYFDVSEGTLLVYRQVLGKNTIGRDLIRAFSPGYWREATYR